MIRTISALALVGLCNLATAVCSQTCTFDTILSSKQLVWCPCYEGLFCARLDVPLDYHNPGLGRASVPMIKRPAQSNSTDGLYQGMIVLIPGGPGGSGVDIVLENGSLIHSVVGTNWDIVSFDPRGTWRAEPLANCSADTATVQSSTLDPRAVTRVANSYYKQWIEFGQQLGENCQKEIGGAQNAGPHMSTVTNTRDILSIVDAFAETSDGKRGAKPSHLLHAWGFSHGTFVGQTFSTLFPDRVGNVVLDGVVSPEGYLANYTSPAIKHLDEALATYFIYCHEAGPLSCPYYTGSTAKEIYERFKQSFAQLDPHRAEAGGWANATDIEAAIQTFKAVMLTVQYYPLSLFSELASYLLELEEAISLQEITSWTEMSVAKFGDPRPRGYTNFQWQFGITCSDQQNKWYNKTFEDLQPIIQELEDQSIIGEEFARNLLGCLGWRIKATETFNGPFGGDTVTPILFVGNTYDPVSPIENAFTSASNFRGAQVLTVDGTGHTSQGSMNICSLAKIKAYFQTTQLLGNDSFCALQAGPFGILLNGTLQDNIAQAGLSKLQW